MDLATALNKILKCPICKETLKVPILFPCTHSVCKQHVDEAVKNESRKLECNICKESHDIPVDGFVLFDGIKRILKEEEKFRKKYNAARDRCERFDELLDDFNRIKNDPDMVIYTVISELRNKIDIRREELKIEIEKIDNEALEMIKKLDEFEKECKANVSSIKTNCTLDCKLDRWRKGVEQWKEILSTYRYEMSDEWTNILNESVSAINMFQLEVFKYNENLLSRLNDFKSMNFSVSSKLDSISVIARGLSNYKYKSGTSPIVLHTVNTLEIDWRLMVFIDKYDENETNDSEYYIEVNFSVIQKSKERNIKIEYDTIIMDQLGMNKSVIRSNNKEFNSRDKGWRDTKMINLEELLENYNLYNVQRDSCKVEVIIKKIEWI